MGSLKILRSVGHNWAHSFLSDIHIVQDTTAAQHLLEAARACNCSKVIVDPLNERVEPASAATLAVREMLRGQAEVFRTALARQRGELSDVRSVELEVEFATLESGPSYSDVRPGVSYSPGIRVPEAVCYTARVTVIDRRGRSHESAVIEFWKS